jgi:DNA mismatch endonuclease, patch repair protein
VDTVSKKKRSWIMAQVKSRGNKSTEQNLMVIFRKHKITGWRRNFPIIGSPDFVFPTKKVAVFVDGCFWHGHPTKCRIPHSNRDYWLNKISRNISRDKLVVRTLRKNGWKVIRIWEDTVEKSSTLTLLKKTLK